MSNYRFAEIPQCLGVDAGNLAFNLSGVGAFQCDFAVSRLATESIAIAAQNVASLAGQAIKPNQVTVDHRLASFWFKWSLRPIGWDTPSPWDPIAGDYECSDGWIRLHTNHHKSPVLKVLGCEETRKSVAAQVANWKAEALETTVVQAGGCAAAMRSLGEWQAHPQGKAIKAEPLVIWESHALVEPVGSDVLADRPLQGIRILDLTRVLAGPVAGRFLAAYGADVLRVDPPWWEEPGVIPEVTLGKRCTELNLTDPADRDTLRSLLKTADVLLHGYRPGALARLGFDTDSLRAINPKLIDVSLSAYGWSGPWAERRGFDSLVQMSCGIAQQSFLNNHLEGPPSLPMPALDQATGYFMAAAVVKALIERRKSGQVSSARMSLARTAQLLIDGSTGSSTPFEEFRAETEHDLDPCIEHTDWGQAKRLRFPVKIEGIDAHYNHPANNLRSAKPQWLSDN